MANVALDMDNQNYKYFETNPHPFGVASQGIDQHMQMMDITQTPDPSLHASAFWRSFPHILGFIFIYIFGGMYFNDDIFYYFPIVFFCPCLLFIFIYLNKQYIFDISNIPSFVNNLSWGFWFGGLSVYIVLTTINSTIPNIMPPASLQNDSNHYGTHHFWQEQIVFTALVLSSLIEEIVKCYLCHRSIQRFHGLGASTSSINTLVLNCTLNATGMAIAKGFLALCLIGNSTVILQQTDNNKDSDSDYVELIYDYRFALLHYIPKAFIYNDKFYPVLLSVIYGLAIVPLHTVIGGLWGIGFVRRFVLEHTIAFGQILMFPWFFHFIVNITISECFYNIIDDEFKDTAAVYGISIAVPVTVTVVATVVFFVLFKRQIDRSISQLHDSNLHLND